MRLAVSFLICIFSLSLAFGQSPSLEEMQQKQQAKIEKAFKAEKLTQLEYDKLMKEQEIIKNTIQVAKADGVFSPDEKNKIRAKINRAEKRLIKYQTNNEVY